jgi:hypothetical protein
MSDRLARAQSDWMQAHVQYQNGKNPEYFPLVMATFKIYRAIREDVLHY